MIPDIINTSIRVNEDMKVPERYIEEAISDAFLSNVLKKSKIEYYEHDDHKTTTINGSVVIMSVEEREGLATHVKELEEEIEDLQRMLAISIVNGGV